MTNEGGDELDKSSLEADFENNSSVVDDELRTRVESAENASIDLAIKERDAGAELRAHTMREPSKARIIILTIFGTLLGACFIFAVVFAAVRLGALDFFKEKPKEAQTGGTDIMLLSYKEESLLYTLGDKEPKESGSYLFADYGLSDDAEYLVITRLAQLNNLQASYSKLSGSEMNFEAMLDVDENFFDSGSVIAVVVEGRYIGSLQTTKLSRDEQFGLNINMLQTNLENVDFVVKPQLAGYLNLIKVENVQPKQLTVFIENNQKEDNGNQEEKQ